MFSTERSKPLIFHLYLPLQAQKEAVGKTLVSNGSFMSLYVEFKKKRYKGMYPQNRNRVIDVTKKLMVMEGALREGG